MINDFLQLFFTVLIIMDPIGIVPLFLSHAGNLGEMERRRVIRKAILIAALVLALFIFGGHFILKFFGISPGAFYISGGILFFLIALDMIYGQKRSTRMVPAEEDEKDPDMIAVFPLAIPLIAGPGLITTIMIYVTANHSWLTVWIMLILAVGLSLVIEYIALRSSQLILKVLGKTGVSVVEKIMGLILSGLSIQLVYDGLVKLGIIGL